MERDGSMNGLEAFDKLSLERGRTLDVEELDDEGWRVASMEKRIEELGSLGEGAGGAVTRCMLKGGKTVFALKVRTTRLLTISHLLTFYQIITTNPDPDVKKQIVRELGFNKDCASEHICRYYGAFVEPSTATISIAMEFCEGGSLDSIYREVKKLGGRTGEKVLGKIAEGVLNGLTYLHSKKIIHRDIKPSNILLCRDGQVKLCDFGVSGEFGTKGDANTFIGTSYYMAPERITGQSYTITSDVWSTGVTLLEVAQHRFPFPADGTEMQPRAGLIDLLTYIVRQPIPKLKDEPDAGIKWSDNFKYFIECWYVARSTAISTLAGHRALCIHANELQSRERAVSASLTLAHARAPLDDRNAQQAREYGTLLGDGLGLGGKLIYTPAYLTSVPIME
jgi:mitogen-activated protein kinase kinase